VSERFAAAFDTPGVAVQKRSYATSRTSRRCSSTSTASCQRRTILPRRWSTTGLPYA
jgi:hypothetical protein